MIMYTIKLQLGPLFDLKCSDIARAEQICEGQLVVLVASQSMKTKLNKIDFPQFTLNYSVHKIERTFYLTNHVFS